MRVSLLGLLFVLAAAAAPARAGVLDLGTAGEFQNLTPYVEIAVDPTGTKTIEQMRSARFVAPAARLELPDALATYWLRFQVHGADAVPWILTAGYRPAQADLYLKRADGTFTVQRSGDLVPHAQRPLPIFNWIAFNLPAAAGAQQLYLRVRTIEPLVNLVAYRADRFGQENIRDIVVIAALLAVLGSLVITGIVLFFVMRDPLYLYYTAFIVAQMIYRANDFGLWQTMVFPNVVWSYVRTEVIFDGMTLVAATAFIRRFLRSHLHSVMLDRINLAIAGIGALYTVLALLGIPVRYTLVQDFSFIYVPVWLITGVVCWRKGYAPARLFIYAWSAFMIGIVIETAVDLGLTAQLGIVRESPLDVTLDYIVYAGIALESILLSLSLAQAFRSATAEKERIAQASITHLRELIEMRERTERMAHLAYNDALTNLPNRVAFIERVDEAMRAALRHSRRCALLYLDFDDFKAINDTFGHQAGDAALIEGAARLRRVIRGDEMVGRLAGDEFAVFIPDVQSSADVDHVVARIKTAFLEPLVVEGHRLPLGISVGTAIFPTESATREELFARADAAMYQAKHQGRERTMMPARVPASE